VISEHLLRYKTANEPTINTDEFTYHSPLWQNTADINGPFEPNKPRMQQARSERTQIAAQGLEQRKTSKNSSFWGTARETHRQHGDRIADRQLTATPQQVTRLFLAKRNCYNINKQHAVDVNRGDAI
jgi:hypothetical protein